MHPKYKEDHAIIAPLIASRLHRNVSNYPLFGSGAITYVFYQHKFSKKMKKSSLSLSLFLFSLLHRLTHSGIQPVYRWLGCDLQQLYDNYRYCLHQQKDSHHWYR